MSGHSKWATTKRQKAVVDAKRSSLFTKLANTIAVAAREGADSTANFKLRMAIEAARALSMPKDNIERAIARGSGSGKGAMLETVTYECFAPGGVALIIEAVTDNKNRTVSEVKHTLSRFGGSLGGSGSVAWMFDRRSIIVVKEPKLTEEQELALIDAGMIDMTSDKDTTTIITPPELLQQVETSAKNAGLTLIEASIGHISKEKVKPENNEQLLSLLEALDNLDDVNNIYTNADI